jgi:hypothetical protein
MTATNLTPIVSTETMAGLLAAADAQLIAAMRGKNHVETLCFKRGILPDDIRRKHSELFAEMKEVAA